MSILQCYTKINYGNDIENDYEHSDKIFKKSYKEIKISTLNRNGKYILML